MILDSYSSHNSVENILNTNGIILCIFIFSPNIALEYFHLAILFAKSIVP